MTKSAEDLKNVVDSYNTLCTSIQRLIKHYENDPDFVLVYITEISTGKTEVKVEYQYSIYDSYKDGVLIFPYDLINKSDEDVITYFKTNS